MRYLLLSQPLLQPVPRVFINKGIIMDDLLPILLVGWVIASWITHIVVCLQTASWGFLIAGAILFPIAWVHGTGIWFGIF
jgi:hypothetical protein